MKTLTDIDVDNKIVLSLLKLGYTEIQLIYAPFFCPDWGWTLVAVKNPPFLENSSCLYGFLGYNTKDALKNISKNQTSIK